MPDFDVSQMIQIGSSFCGSISHSIGILLHVSLIILKQRWWMGRQLNVFPFCVIASRRPVYVVMSGKNTDKYWTSPTKHCIL
ncbi:hypothetical protein ARMGADRAFT_1113321 [Armillaria gallica]|uniref:Uncharacterized protein n=1 Tax=Armillaria gallica TaxID=47427 RepID=A0A2H3D5Y4_ARMGA|nr:hypothetical protein ARMGADRAFT_1113321 [Armillaria gallica]